MMHTASYSLLEIVDADRNDFNRPLTSAITSSISAAYWLCYKYDFGVAMVEHVRQLRDAGAHVQRHRDKATVHRSQEQLRGEQPIIHQEGDLVAVLQAHLPKASAQSVGRAREAR